MGPVGAWGVWWVFWATKAWTWSRAGGGQAAASHGWELSKSQTCALPHFHSEEIFAFFIGKNLETKLNFCLLQYEHYIAW